MALPRHGDSGRVGLWGVVAIGIGGMVGGGIFAVLGLSVQIAGGGAPIAISSRGSELPDRAPRAARWPGSVNAW